MNLHSAINHLHYHFLSCFNCRSLFGFSFYGHFLRLLIRVNMPHIAVDRGGEWLRYFFFRTKRRPSVHASCTLTTIMTFQGRDVTWMTLAVAQQCSMMLSDGEVPNDQTGTTMDFRYLQTKIRKNQSRNLLELFMVPGQFLCKNVPIIRFAVFPHFFICDDQSSPPEICELEKYTTKHMSQLSHTQVEIEYSLRTRSMMRKERESPIQWDMLLGAWGPNDCNDSLIIIWKRQQQQKMASSCDSLLWGPNERREAEKTDSVEMSFETMTIKKKHMGSLLQGKTRGKATNKLY